jgi:hypothetical protein
MCRPAWIRARGPSVIDSGVRPAATFLITSAEHQKQILHECCYSGGLAEPSALCVIREQEDLRFLWIALNKTPVGRAMGRSVGWVGVLAGSQAGPSGGSFGRSASMCVSEWRSLNEQIHPAAAAPVPRVIWPTLGWICHSFPLQPPPSVGRRATDLMCARYAQTGCCFFYHICCSRSEGKWVGTSMGWSELCMEILRNCSIDSPKELDPIYKICIYILTFNVI